MTLTTSILPGTYNGVFNPDLNHGNRAGSARFTDRKRPCDLPSSGVVSRVVDIEDTVDGSEIFLTTKKM